MAEVSFENRLLRMFDEPPPMPDADRFARRVEARLDRGWNLRQLTIGSFGILGGAIGVFQMARSGFVPQVEAASRKSASLLTSGLGDLWNSATGYAAMPLSGEVLWMAAALGVMALALAVTRAVEEF